MVVAFDTSAWFLASPDTTTAPSMPVNRNSVIIMVPETWPMTSSRLNDRAAPLFA